MSAPTQYGFEQARAQLPTLMAQAHAGQSSVITKHGKPYAAIVPLADRTRDQARCCCSQRPAVRQPVPHSFVKRVVPLSVP